MWDTLRRLVEGKGVWWSGLVVPMSESLSDSSKMQLSKVQFQVLSAHNYVPYFSV